MLALLLSLSAVPAVGKGLFMSATAANASQIALQEYLRAVELASRAPYNLSTSPQHINSIAIQAVANKDGALYTTALDRIIPTLVRFPRLYIGTVIPRGTDFYCADVLNAKFVSRAVNVSGAAARAFVDRYAPLLPGSFAWYISPEQFLNHLAEGCTAQQPPRRIISASELAAAWGMFLRSWTQALAAARPGTRILWSPAAPESVRRGTNGSAAYAAALSASLRSIATAAPLLTDIAVQDSVGKASNASVPGHIAYPVGCPDAAWHANISRSALAAAPACNVTTTVNMELFLRKGRRLPPSAIVDLPAEPYEARRREVCYAGQDMELGPCWEARFWLRDKTQEWLQ
eukprot:g4132.t1